MSDVAAIEPDIADTDADLLETSDTEEEGEELGAARISDLSEEQQDEILSYTERPMIPVALLAEHPGNVRQDKKAPTAFCRSVAQVGILTPLEITYEPDRNGYRVVDGNIRLDAAIKVGLEQVPYVFSEDTVDDEGLQKLHMVVTSHWRTDLTPKEEAQALFDASELGMSATSIRQATGLKTEVVKAALRAGTLTDTSREAMATVSYDWTIDEMALVAEFQNDEEAMERLVRSRRQWNPQPLRYVVERIKEERAEAKRRIALLEELEAAGITVEDELPKKATYITDLLSSAGEQMDADAHADCPGRGATLSPYAGAEPRYFCKDAVRHRHVWAATGSTDKPTKKATQSAASSGGEGQQEDEESGLPRKVVIEGNIAWPAASVVRQEFLNEFLSRKTPPKDLTATIARFVTKQYMTMPEPLCRALDEAKHTSLFGLNTKLTRTAAGEAVEKSSLPGLWMLALAPIASAYEREMVGTGERRSTWREDKYSPCNFTDAGEWMRFCITIGAKHGWEPSPIETALAEQRPYRGDTAEGEADLSSAVIAKAEATASDGVQDRDNEPGEDEPEDKAEKEQPEKAQQPDTDTAAEVEQAEDVSDIADAA